MWIAISFLVLVALFAFVTMGVYNGLVGRKNRYQNAFAQIDVQLRRRYDLIPNLVETAKRYLSHERDTLEAVIAARNAAVAAERTAAQSPGDARAMQQLASAEGALQSGLGRLMVVSEAYPELKANDTMRGLSEELTSTENKVAFARQAYNDAVAEYNTAREVFPAVMLAGMFGFSTAALLEAVESVEQRSAPKVAF